jgi:hypothetical protein
MSEDKILVQPSPGAARDPARLECFQLINLACAGKPIGSVLAALIDSLATTVLIVADDRAHANDVAETILGDLRKAIARNFDEVKAQLPTAIVDGGRA